MKLMYRGCHSILEYDELKIFEQIEGLELFSTGRYFHTSPTWSERPPLNFPVDGDNYIVWDKCKGQWNNKEFLDRFDILYFMHRPKDIIDNWSLLKNRKIIWRTIGQSTSELELKMLELKRDNPNMKIVRYSPNERRHQNFSGEDALIRFSKNPDDYGPWNGNIKKVLSVAQSMKARGNYCGWEIFSKISERIPCQLVGYSNKNAGDLWIGKDLSYEELIEVYKDFGVYFYTGTKPASYCLNFIEAWMSGIPVVAVGPMLGNMKEELYEVHELITYGKDGYWADSSDSIMNICKMLLEDDKLAKSISKSGRAKAIEIFDENKIKFQWKDFFNTFYE